MAEGKEEEKWKGRKNVLFYISSLASLKSYKNKSI